MTWFCQDCETDNPDDVLFCEVCGAERNVKHAETKNNGTNEFELWNTVCKKNTIKAYNEYISAYPGGKYIRDAHKRITNLHDDRYWRNIERENTIEAYKTYLQLYPDGRHKTEAAKVIDTHEKTKKKYVSGIIICLVIVLFIFLLQFGVRYVKNKGTGLPAPQEKPIQDASTISDIEEDTEILMNAMEIARSMNAEINVTMKKQANTNLQILKQADSPLYNSLKQRYDRL